MNITYKKISEITLYERNPRRNDQAVDYVVNSIKEFGFKVPIVIDKNNTIVCGHTRIKAAQKLDLKEVPCIIADDLTEVQIQAFRLADNKVAELADWDFELLSDEIELIKGDFDIKDFGFEVGDFEAKTQTFKNSEIDNSEFDDDKFNKKCPKCGFKWNENA